MHVIARNAPAVHHSIVAFLMSFASLWDTAAVASSQWTGGRGPPPRLEAAMSARVPAASVFAPHTG